MEEQKPKRPIFTPIVLILLTFSLIGNVFLFTKMIQSNQDKLAERGYAVMDAVPQTKLHIDQVLAGVQELMGSDEIGKRLAAKSALGAAFHQKPKLVRLIDEAAIVNDKPFEAKKRDAAAFLDQVEASLQSLGNHDGSLTASERAYLQQISDVYMKLKAAVQSLNYKTVNRTTALTVLVDPKWVDASSRMLAVMNEPDQLSFKP
ncbi:hypothetical protein ACFPYJ_22075 [Paenibacillus solisilvae]|uniref:Chemotaxis methyl-accepting receptor HlyB-like 4HB MCP domain-containing protein n=1 Tax=Paenibacillus solisilvae TaxID=2486751 RepID=A0ABW0W4S2_9BACL